MARYTNLQLSDAQAIASEYDLELINFTLIDGGAGSSNYLLHTNQGKYVMTISEITSARADILGELLLLLADVGYPTTRLLPPKNGGLYVMYLDKPVLVKPFINGCVYKDLSENMLTQIGSAMGRLHQLPAPAYLHDEHAYGLQAFPNVIGVNLNPKYEDWLEERLFYLRRNIPAGLPRGLIHGDLFYDNVLFNDKNLKAIIDFEEACSYYQVFDLGMGILGLCMHGTRLDLDKARALVSGYQHIRELEVMEKEVLQLFTEYAAIATSYWRFWMYNLHTPIPKNAQNYLHMVRCAEEVAAIPARKFVQAIFK